MKMNKNIILKNKIILFTYTSKYKSIKIIDFNLMLLYNVLIAYIIYIFSKDKWKNEKCWRGVNVRLKSKISIYFHVM